MKHRVLALLLCLLMLANTLLLGGCSLLTPPGTEEPEKTDPEGTESEGTESEGAEPEDGEPSGGYNPGGWFESNTPLNPDEQDPYSYRIQRKKLLEVLEATLSQVDHCAESYDGKFPGAYSSDYVYRTNANTAGWVQGFWPGVLWHAYELSEDESYKELALSHVASFHTRIDERLGVDNHDMGFLYTPSCVAAYKLTGDETAKAAAILAADNLLSRFHEDAGFIQAWGTVGDAAEYRLIVDCLMNLPILYWASEVTGDEKYSTAANRHLENSLSTLYREDGSTYHTYFFDPDTKQPSHGATKQGYSDESTWARGQGWAIYGPVLAYSYTGSERALEYFKKAADCFIDKLSSDYVPYWDFTYTDGSSEPRDTSAGAIAVCALLEGASRLDDSDPDKDKYLFYAHKIMNALIDNYAAADQSGANGLLTGATQNRMTEKGVEEMTPFGDYFYIEALHRMLDPEWNMYW